MAGPVIVITGTPGTGKTTHAQLLAETSPVPLEHINVGDWVKERGLHEGFDSEWQTYTVDEDKVSRSFACSLGWQLMMTQLLDELEPRVESGGVILDWHSCEVFPERWPDLVIVLRCDHTKLWDRLERRSVCAVRGAECDNVDGPLSFLHAEGIR